MIPRRTLLLGLAAVGLGACGGGGGDKKGPPSISYGNATCDRCHMAIEDEHHAAAFVREDGTTMRFDDTGELVATVQELGLGSGHAWVHDYETAEWIDATAATYAWMPSGATPMGTGIVAFKTAERATAFAAEREGWTKSWAEMLSGWTLA